MKECPINKIRDANRRVLDRIARSEPILYDVRLAGEIMPFKNGKTILHAGPPINWPNMSGAMRGAIIGAILYEKWAHSLDDAMALANSTKISYYSTHDFGIVAPMAGIITPSMYLLCVKNLTFDKMAFSNLNEGLGQVLRFGCYKNEVLTHLHWLNEVLGPILKATLKLTGPIALRPIMINAVKSGDECHNRHVAANKFFIDFLRPYLIRIGLHHFDVVKVLEYIERNYYFFLNISLAACKSIADATSDIPYSTIVSALSRNGYETGIRISGLGDSWYVDKSFIPSGNFFDGYCLEDANADMGDSTITETVGIGAFAMAAAPQIVDYLGGNADDVIRYSELMYQITFGENKHFQINQFGNRGTPTGIDILKVCETGITPIINTGIAHKDGGIGQIGAGYVRAPIGCFEKALNSFEKKYGKIYHPA